ncbi:Protein of unknown function with PCYCGC motif-containing protein [Bryocella elongata]|uniref:Uncharacterized protein n=1 Tax=Bryocella elongata TaxID=863522 RepID=A0A1H5UBL0_9BACT|nr:CYCXC family (seleno)protein [Bryocella elongata]SEF72443.1 Protein of unknown function with PCYCGC motif-containing protein [Bryocella elongata]
MKRVLGCLAAALLTVGAYAQFGPASDVPAYHPAAPSAAMPPLMHGTQLSGEYFTHGYQVTSYKMAASVERVLWQEPCYCRCDRGMGHKSLHSCFEVTHGAACSTCMKEAAYTYQETKKGRSPAQIRDAIERGEWELVDLDTIKM